MEIAQRLERIATQQAELEAEKNLLGQLPQDLDVESLFPIQGEWQLKVNGKLPQLLEMLPPQNARMSLVGGMWFSEPEDRPLDWNQRVLAVTQSRYGVEWHHKLPSGVRLAVQVAKAKLPIPEGYERVVSLHTTVAVRKLQDVSTPEVVSPDTAFSDAWNAFFATEDYRTTRRILASVFRTLSSRNVELSFDMLPNPAADVMQLGDATLLICRPFGQRRGDTYPEGSPLQALERMGDFWGCFDVAEAKRLIAFANAQRCDLDKIQGDALDEGFAKAIAAVKEFEATHLGKAANGPDAAVLQRWIREKTGLAVKVEITPKTPLKSNSQFSVWLALWGSERRLDLSLPTSYERTGFDFQNPSFYQYVPNNQRFFEEQAVPA